MKHILNNLSEEEKNAIREQHTGGMKVMTENFSKLINSKLGDSKPLVNEQVKISQPSNEDIIRFINAVNVNRFKFDSTSSDAKMAFKYKGKPLTYVGPFGSTIFLDKNGKRINTQTRDGKIATFNIGSQDFDKVMSWLETNTRP
jgi:hypothetical protein